MSTWMNDRIVRHENSAYLVISCRTLHFQKIIGGSTRAILEGDICVRIIPCTAIEAMHEPEPDTRFDAAPAGNPGGNLVPHNKYMAMIARAQDFGE